MVLSNRMRAVVRLVQPCDSIADIGCDHGYVAIELIKSNICGRVIAMDVNKGPLERALSNIREHGLEDKIETRLSNGTKALEPGEAKGIICAGMGGRLIISILEEGGSIVSDMDQLILQPQSEIEEVRLYLRTNGYKTFEEDMVLEDGKYYPMMRVAKSGEPDNKESDIQKTYDKYGRYLLEKTHPILKEYLLWQKKGILEIKENLIGQDKKNKRQLDRIEELDRQLDTIDYCLKKYYIIH